MIVLVILVVGAAAFTAGWRLATLRSPGALGLGDPVSIKHGGVVVAEMLLTDVTQQWMGPDTATLQDRASYLNDRKVWL